MSRFVSGGSLDKPADRDEAWKKAQEEIEANHRQKVEEAARQDDGKSLYEVLQANKAAKQDAFEESIRLKNQFRHLDEDEVEFLDSVLESKRAQDTALRNETSEKLAAFRKHQEEVERAALGNDGSPVGSEEGTWVTSGKKRKKGKDNEILKGVKLRKTSSLGQKSSELVAESPSAGLVQDKKVEATEAECVPTAVPSTTKTPLTQKPSSEASPPNIKKPSTLPIGLGLGDYSSDEDD